MNQSCARTISPPQSAKLQTSDACFAFQFQKSPVEIVLPFVFGSSSFALIFLQAGERIVIVYDQNHAGDRLARCAILEIRKSI
jgi:hypothetical protein